MVFEEDYPFIVHIPVVKTYVYFLCQDANVVYVGQSSVGLSRPFNHKDKKFNKVMVLPCTEEMLDDAERRYIEKYRPKYNKAHMTVEVTECVRRPAYAKKKKPAPVVPIEKYMPKVLLRGVLVD